MEEKTEVIEHDYMEFVAREFAAYLMWNYFTNDESQKILFDLYTAALGNGDGSYGAEYAKYSTLFHDCTEKVCSKFVGELEHYLKDLPDAVWRKKRG